MTNHVYKSENARRMAEERKAKQKANPPRDSKKFQNGSNPHHGASRSQSGQPKQGNR